IPNSSTTTSSTKAATSRRGNSRNSSHKSFARASDHCASSGRKYSARPSEVTALLLSTARVHDRLAGGEGWLGTTGRTRFEPRYSAAASCCSRSHWAAATAIVRDHGRRHALFPQRRALRVGARSPLELRQRAFRGRLR